MPRKKKNKTHADHQSIDVVLSSYTNISRYPNDWSRLEAYIEMITYLVEIYGKNHNTYTYVVEKSYGVYLNRIDVSRFPIVIFPEEGMLPQIDLNRKETILSTGWMRIEDHEIWFSAVRSILADLFNFLVPIEERKKRLTLNN